MKNKIFKFSKRNRSSEWSSSEWSSDKWSSDRDRDRDNGPLGTHGGKADLFFYAIFELFSGPGKRSGM